LKKIGITGGIGSGKSTVSKVFALLNVPIYNADNQAKHLLNNDVDVILKVKKVFGNDIYNNQELDRKKMAAQVFEQPFLLQQLNKIVHPAVFNDFDKWCDSHQQHTYILKEAALIFETILHQKLDAVIMVSSAEELRIERVMKRDSITKEQVLARIKNQMSEDEKLNRADYIIYNDELQMVIPQVVQLHEQFMNTK
jgi:dephospho-CoA kinase